MMNIEEILDNLNLKKHYLIRYWGKLYEYLNKNWMKNGGSYLNFSFEGTPTFRRIIDFSIPEARIFEYKSKRVPEYRIMYTSSYVEVPITIQDIDGMTGPRDFYKYMLEGAVAWLDVNGIFLLNELINKMTFAPINLGLAYDSLNPKPYIVRASITMGTIDIPIFPSNSVSIIRWT